ncbi:carbohydrate-binding module family 20 domain-containing protein [Niveibacterium sp. SC-1]|uniref:carbohydrate-binding module family 20 domain-containing protein n=1 Tax=Niveibacterium sp. SC-1 TaxID=3135646 RepID=UPI00311D36DC
MKFASPVRARSRSRAGALVRAAFLSAALGLPALASAQSTARTAFVQLFEWKWTDVAKECASYLGPKGFAAVQVSPPNEHNWISSGDGAPYPWWMRYQPVSYSLDRSRSGTRAEFIAMVNQCKAAGVGIYVDAVINHMSAGNSGTSSAGRGWSWHNYPGLYGVNDFHSPVCGISNSDYTGSIDNVQNCELSGLQDLNTSTSYVRGKIADYLVDLANIGVAGFRVDAAKHMSPTDLGAIIDNVNARVGTNKPFWFLEVIGASGEVVQPSQYFGLAGGAATVTEFAFGPKLYDKFAGGGKLADLKTFGESWGLMGSSKAIAFVDNHDKQRNHGGGGNYITYHSGSTYDLANVFMLAWPYGYPALMSSYAFNRSSTFDTSYGPPFNSDGSTKGPWDGGVTSPACFNQSVGGWVCEHRWRSIGNMVSFRNATVANWTVTDWWDNGNNQVAFGRGNKGFVAINKEGTALTRTFKTSLPAAKYCDVISGDYDATAKTCSGTVVTVDASGNVTMTVPANGAAAIHVDAVVGTTPPPAGASLTVRAQGVTLGSGESVYVVGDAAALGAWSPCSATKLSAGNGEYSATLSVPASTAVQYKFIKYSNCNSASWEAGNNRSTTTAATGGSSSVCGVFGSTAACTTTGTTANVNFTVQGAAPASGQVVYVTGNVAALGNWAPCSAVPLTVGSDGSYSASVALPAATAVQYKFLKFSSCSSPSWEAGNNRAVTTPAAGGSAAVCGVFGSTAGCSTGGTTASVTFNVSASVVSGQSVYVLGSIPALASWNTANALALASTGTSNWSKTLELPPSTSFEYKYIKKDSAGNVTWESGSNRVVTSAAAGVAQTLNDSWK